MQEISQDLKYTIKKRINNMDGHPRSNAYKICIAIGVSIQTLNNWMNVLKDAKFSIPTDEFYKIAEQLKCNPDELFTSNDLINNG